MEKNSNTSIIKNFFNGLFLGVTLLAPGLSVATIAMVLRIYAKLLDSISDFFSPRFKSSLRFLIPLGIGGAIAVLLSSRVISWAMSNHHYQTHFLFLGLAIGAVPMLFHTVDAKNTFQKKHYITLVIAFVTIAALSFVNIPETENIITSLDTMTVIQLLLTGAIATAAMLLPGLSAALMLLLLGTYATLTHAVSEFNFLILAIAGVGGIIGLILSSRGIRYLLKNYLSLTYAASIGMVIGSVVVIFPGVPREGIPIMTSIVMFLVGFAVVLLIDARGKKN
ncbi:MAG: DUF368 domain-containing protein [Lachnospiraceae bacterium]|nr:DUF368 domain-containing protein [Lachnospiraceae bacterium]